MQEMGCSCTPERRAQAFGGSGNQRGEACQSTQAPNARRGTATQSSGPRSRAGAERGGAPLPVSQRGKDPSAAHRRREAGSCPQPCASFTKARAAATPHLPAPGLPSCRKGFLCEALTHLKLRSPEEGTGAGLVFMKMRSLSPLLSAQPGPPESGLVSK